MIPKFTYNLTSRLIYKNAAQARAVRSLTPRTDVNTEKAEIIIPEHEENKVNQMKKNVSPYLSAIADKKIVDKLVDRRKKQGMKAEIWEKLLEIGSDPNKMQGGVENPYLKLFQAIANGNLPSGPGWMVYPEKGKGVPFALMVIRSLDPDHNTKAEIKRTVELLDKLRDSSSSALTWKVRQNYLEDMEELRKVVRFESRGTAGVQEDTRKKFAAAERKKEKAKTHKDVKKTVGKTAFTHSSGATSSAYLKVPEAVKDHFHELIERHKTVVEEGLKHEKEIEQLREQDSNVHPLTPKVNAQQLTEKLQALEKEEKELAAQIESELLEYLRTKFHQFKDVESLKLGTGLHLDPGTEISVEDVDLNELSTEKNPTIKRTTITIVDIEVEDDGTVLVRYKDRHGKEDRAGLPVFKENMSSLNGYEPYFELDTEMQYLLRNNLKTSTVEELEGETFKREMAQLEDGTTETPDIPDEFKIVKIYKKEVTDPGTGKSKTETYVQTDKPINLKPATEIADSAPRQLKRQEKPSRTIFALGEIVTYICNHNFQRTLTTAEDTQKSINGGLAAEKKMADQYLEMLPASLRQVLREQDNEIILDEPLIVPPLGGPGSEIAFRNILGNEEQGKLYSLSNRDGKQVYVIAGRRTANNLLVLDPQKKEDNQFYLNQIFEIEEKERRKNGGNGGSDWRDLRIVNTAEGNDALHQMANKHEIGGHAAGHGAAAANSDAAAVHPEEEGHGEAGGHGDDHGGHAGHDDEHAEHPEPEQKKSKEVDYAKESLPYNVIHKVGGMTRPEVGLIEQTWNETTFVSVMDLWELGKACYEYYERRYKRNQQDRFSTIGENLPYFAPEMRRINQAAENEEVSHFKEAFEQKGIFEIEERLHATHNQDELRTCIDILVNKGHMNWWDIGLWESINRFVRKENYYIPIPSNGDPYTEMGPNDSRTGRDFLEGAIDHIWGEGTFAEWYAHSESTWTNHSKEFDYKGKELEGVEGGHERRLSELLRRHKDGEYVDPHEYEGLILQAITDGKSSIETKVYYLVEGVAAENHHGHTIMPFNRIAQISGLELTKFPIFEYLTGTGGIMRKEGVRAIWTLEDYKHWRKMFDQGNDHNVHPTQAVDKFIWEHIIPSEQTQNRINKAMRHGDNIDHDDMCYYVPPASESVIMDTCRAATGNKKLLTYEGYANVYPGFSQYIKTLTQYGYTKKVKDAIKSYVRFNSIMLDKFKKGDKDFARLDNTILNNPPIVSDNTPNEYIQELDDFVGAVVKSYGDQGLQEKWDLISTNTRKMSMRKKENKELQEKIEEAISTFSDTFDEVFEKDDGKNMMAVATQFQPKFKGMPYTPPLLKAKKKAQRLSQASGH